MKKAALVVAHQYGSSVGLSTPLCYHKKNNMSNAMEGTKMSKTCVRIFFAFVLGQVAQIVLAAVAKVSYMDKPILFCIAAGFILLVAVFAGTRLATTEKEEPKSYLDYANGRSTK